MSPKARTGDVFLIPIDDTRFGLGQIAGNWKGELYIVIYEECLSDGKPNPECVVTAKPLFAALSLDAKIHHGDWPIIGNITSNLGKIPQPVFKVGQDGQVFLESRDRSISRPASRSEADRLKLRTVVAPIRLEKALKAHHGVGEWDTIYDELKADYAFDSARLLTN